MHSCGATGRAEAAAKTLARLVSFGAAAACGSWISIDIAAAVAFSPHAPFRRVVSVLGSGERVQHALLAHRIHPRAAPDRGLWNRACCCSSTKSQGKYGQSVLAHRAMCSRSTPERSISGYTMIRHLAGNSSGYEFTSSTIMGSPWAHGYTYRYTKGVLAFHSVSVRQID